MTTKSKSEQDLEIIKYASYFKRHAESFFFAAMMQGYVGENEKLTISELPGSKCIEHVEGRWRLLDTYMVTPLGDRSGGTTILWYGDVPIWMMQYLGWYAEEAIPCLKAALRVNYEEDVFNGGRGPDMFELDGYRYQNFVEQNDFFGHANGLERIYVPDGALCGMHRYQSQWLKDSLW